MADMIGENGFKSNLRERLSRPETIILLLVTLGFMLNVQQGYHTNGVLRNDPLVFKGIRILTIIVAQIYAIWIVMKRGVLHSRCFSGPILPLALYFCCCVISVPFSPYPLLSLFKSSEVGLVILLSLIGLSSVSGTPADFFRLNIKIVLFYNIIIWIESVLFPNAAWYPLHGDMPFFSHALSGVFPVVNGNMVGLFGAVLVLAYLPRLYDSDRLNWYVLIAILMGVASTIYSYSRTSLLGLIVSAMCSLILLRKYSVVLVIILCVAMVGVSQKARTLAVNHLARGQESRDLNTLSSDRLEMWEMIFSRYHSTLFGRGYAAGFRYDKNLTTGHAHNSIVELFFDVGILGVIAWMLLIGTVCRHLYYRLRSQVSIDHELVSIVGVMLFLLIKSMASTVFVHLDVSMLIMVGIIIYVTKQYVTFQMIPKRWQ